MISQFRIHHDQKIRYTPLLSDGVLTRKCTTCGQRTISDGDCSKCRYEPTTSSARGTIRVSLPGDRQEREADQVAESIMRRPSSLLTAALNEGKLPLSDESIMRHPSSLPTAALNEGNLTLPDHPTLGNSPGAPLPSSIREFMEPRFGTDFSRVRIHTDHEAAQLSHQLNAQAFTVGADIYFGADRFHPETQAGKTLLAHELTHVLQKRAGTVSPHLIQRVCDIDHLDNSTPQRLGQFTDLVWTGVDGSGDVDGPQPVENYQQWDPDGSGDYSRTAISTRHISGTINHPTVPNCSVSHESWVQWFTVTEFDFPLQFSGNDYYRVVSFVFQETQSGSGCNTTIQEDNVFQCQEVDDPGTFGLGDALNILGSVASIAATVAPGIPPPP